MKKAKQPDNGRYQIAAPKEFADKVAKDGLRKPALKLILEYVVLIIVGLGLGIGAAKLQQRFHLDTGVIKGIVTAIYIVLILFAGYSFYRYFKEAGDDDE